MKFSTQYPDAQAPKRVYNAYIICHLTFKPKRDIDELKQMLMTLRTVFLMTSSTKPLTSGKHGYVHM